MEKMENLAVVPYKPSPLVATATPLRSEAQIIERSVCSSVARFVLGSALC